MASDLRDEIARAVAETTDLPGTWDRFPDERAGWLLTADAVLRVVGEAMMSDEAVEAVAMTYEPDTFVGDAPHADEALHDARDVLSAAWRVVTGSNHE